MAVALHDLPEYLVLKPTSTVRLDMHLDEPSCEIDVTLGNPKPGRSFVLMIGHPGGPFVQRVRLSGRARIFFDPESPGDYVLLLTNPDRAPVVLRLRARAVRPASTKSPALGPGRRVGAGRPRGRARTSVHPARPRGSPARPTRSQARE